MPHRLPQKAVEFLHLLQRRCSERAVLIEDLANFLSKLGYNFGHHGQVVKAARRHKSVVHSRCRGACHEALRVCSNGCSRMNGREREGQLNARQP